MNKEKNKDHLLEKHRLGLGCWAFGGAFWGGQEEKDSREAMEAAVEMGIHHFDTASGYANSEEVVGRFLPSVRDRIFLASKSFPRKGGPELMREVVEKSLERLNTDHIDLYYIHWPFSGMDIKAYVEVLAKAREDGLIRHLGVSNFSVEQIKVAQEVAPIDFLQVGYHLFWRYIEKDLIPFCRAEGIHVVAYSSLAQGILTGKFGPKVEFPEGDNRGKAVIHFREDVWPHVYAATERLKPLAEKAGRPLSHLALQWAARQPGIGSVLVGARNRAQMQENAAALEPSIEEGILQEMIQISDELLPHLPETTNIFGNDF
jgi:aryl-alcohol dehydrogenase-like predicted oxidoreductase